MRKNEKTTSIKSDLQILQQFLWPSREIRGSIQDAGLNVVPSNFYSSIPSIKDVIESFEYAEDTPFLVRELFENTFLRRYLDSLLEFSCEFNPPINGDENSCTDYFWDNSQFSYSDAMAYYSTIRKLKPNHIVEIGAGFSSLVALAALKKNGFGKLTCVEPYPRPFLESREDIDLVQIKVQDLTAKNLNSLISDGDILFIDSTHTVKSGSDCLHLYLRLLPEIKHKIFIHIHDIFLPFGMPKDWLLDHQIYWTEQYLLLAWMIDNPYVSVLFGCAYNQEFNLDLMEGLMHGRYPSGGGSFWIEYRGNQKFAGVGA